MKVFIPILLVHIALATSCTPESSGVCRCTGKYCDSVDPVGIVAKGQYVMYQTSKGGDRLKRSTGNFVPKPDKSRYTIKVDPTKTFQSIVGFGGALTDAAILNIDTMNSDVQQQIFNQYFGADGIGYNLARIPMAGCDFSTHSYTYDDHPGDFNMSKFSVEMDMVYKIPFILKVLKNSVRKLKLFASPWSPPAWLKSNNSTTGGKFISDTPGDQYHKAWALYFDKFLAAYREQGIYFWGITTQNEPATPRLYKWDSCHTSPEQQRDFIKMDLGPLLNFTHPEVKIIMHDDQRSSLDSYTSTVLADPVANSYVHGVGFHWYAAVEDIIPYFSKVQAASQKYPDKFFLGTEACEGFLPWKKGPLIGDWTRGETYGHDILGDLNAGAGGWTDWNIVLDLKGGPNHAGNVVDAPIIADTKNKTYFIKQPMFYYLGHFTKFLTPGSVRIAAMSTGFLVIPGLETTAFITPEKQIVVIVLNRDSHKRTYWMHFPDAGYIRTSIGAHAIQTFIFNA